MLGLEIIILGRRTVQFSAHTFVEWFFKIIFVLTILLPYLNSDKNETFFIE